MGRRGRMTNRSRIALAIASLLLLSVFFLPIWKIDLQAPQYPEGLGLYIEVNTIRGVEKGNLESINGLNHYIGMKEIHPESIPELKIMPWLFAALIVLGLGAAAYGHRWALYTWVGLFTVLALVGLVDFYMWEYDYGHNLDHERAIIKVPGMSYQPPLIGSKKMLNITAVSLPALGGILAFLSLSVGVALAATEMRLRRHKNALSVAFAATALAGVVLAGCTTGPRPLAYGEDICEHCKMIIVDSRFGAEIVTEKGRVMTFDSIECLTAYLHLSDVAVATAWVVDMGNPGMLIPAETAHFVRSDAIPSPMGGYVAAFGSIQDRDEMLKRGGEALAWSEVLLDNEQDHDPSHAHQGDDLPYEHSDSGHQAGPSIEGGRQL